MWNLDYYTTTLLGDDMEELLLEIRQDLIRELQLLESPKPNQKAFLDYLLSTDDKYYKRGLGPTSQKQYDFMTSKATITVFGGAAGSGKSYCGLLDLLKWVHLPLFRGVVFRRTNPQLKGAGGMWDTANGIYNELVEEFMGDKLKVTVQELKMTFPTQATISMRQMEHVKDKFNIQGWQIGEGLVDEATQFELEQIMYIISRLRTPADMPSHLKMTCNPDADSFLRGWLERAEYLDKEGYPLEDQSGVIRYCGEISGQMEFTKTEEEWRKKYPKVNPMTFTFIPATCRDNPVLLKMEPDYLTKLENMPRVEKARLLDGNWFARAEASGYFKREWCGTPISAYHLPRGKRWVRSWDKAATLPSEIYPDPDYTVGLKGTVDDEGTVYVTDMVRGRWRPSGVQQAIEDAAKNDGNDCTITIPVDAGAAGKAEADSCSSKLFGLGYTVRQKKTSNTAKVKRFEPVAALAENGMIKVVKGDWNEAFFTELENFTGDQRGHDDICDALSDLVNELIMKKHIGDFSLPDLNGLTGHNVFKQ